MPIRTKKTALLYLSQVLVLGLVGFLLFVVSPNVQAASTITVTTQSDVSANDGECTLREAITSANNDAASGAAVGECMAGSGADTIEFNISGTADFTNGGEDGYTIEPQTQLPDVTEQVTINGYSQPGAEANTAVAPNPLNGMLLIEIDGSNAENAGALTIRADQTQVRGLVINNFSGSAALILSDDVVIQGNYIGTDPEGDHAKPNSVGVNTFNGTPDAGEDARIGGLNPEERNIISGNTAGGGASSGGYPGSGWVFQGNYIGLAADGLTPIANSYVGGSGGLSIDNTTGTIIGGTDPGAINVISGNNADGLSPHGVEGLTIQGNYIGTDYTGMVEVPNGGSGIGLSSSEGVAIGGSANGARNIISGNDGEGIWMHQSNDIDIKGNYVGVLVDGLTAAPNGRMGIGAQEVTGIVGGNSAGDSNIIANTDSTGGFGIIIMNSSTLSVIGNSIYDNNGPGISFNGGVTDNDILDPDIGPNDLLNFPEYTNMVEAAGNTTVDYQLDVPTGDYRIEFFSSTTLDPSGRGEGEEYLGFQNVTSTGPGLQAYTHELVGVTNVTNLAMTATEIDNSDDGFGATSEFGGQGEAPDPVIDISIAKTLSDPQNVAPGSNIHYGITVTNSGPDEIDLTTLNGGGNPFVSNVLIDFLPPELIYVSSSNPDLTCTDTGTTFPTLLAANHLGWHAITCSYSGSGQILESGESISTVLEVTVVNNSDLVFTNYALASIANSDPDAGVVGDAVTAAFGNGGVPDFIDAMVANPTNNFAAATYSPTVDSGNGSGSGGNNAGGGILAGTGQTTLLIAGIASLLLLSAGTVLSRRAR